MDSNIKFFNFYHFIYLILFIGFSLFKYKIHVKILSNN